METDELAREFILGLRANLACPDVSPSEDEKVIEGRLEMFRAEIIEQCAERAQRYFNTSDSEPGVPGRQEVHERLLGQGVASAIRRMI